jgi:hypothetical protein
MHRLAQTVCLKQLLHLELSKHRSQLLLCFAVLTDAGGTVSLLVHCVGVLPAQAIHKPLDASMHCLL